MVYIFLCVDFDRDAAFPAIGHKHAVSQPKQAEMQDILADPEKSAEIQGSIEGFGQILSVLIQKKLPAVFYFEARTIDLISKRHPEFLERLNQPFFEMGVHGYDHEDLVGEETGLPLEKQEEFNLIKKAKERVEELFSTKVIGFRAPYMRLTENTRKILVDLDFVYDSSIYQESDKAIIPYSDEHGRIEFPVIKTPKESLMKGMYTYLWPLFEGKRGIKEIISNYIQLIHNSTEDSAYISINLHSWHFAYNIEQNCYLSQKEIRKNTEFLIKLIAKLEELEGVQFSTPKLWLEENELLNN
ncbi:MAG: polysaccharide deacetylase family protein, partial [Candidatus Heimdallarchaeota archaeon]|nr:polysaccharide deacetylase family protein [Candidatus Heimdallarchaeota archaeon]